MLRKSSYMSRSFKKEIILAEVRNRGRRRWINWIIYFTIPIQIKITSQSSHEHRIATTIEIILIRSWSPLIYRWLMKHYPTRDPNAISAKMHPYNRCMAPAQILKCNERHLIIRVSILHVSIVSILNLFIYLYHIKKNISKWKQFIF